MGTSGIELTNPGSAVSYASVARPVTDCAARFKSLTIYNNCIVSKYHLAINKSSVILNSRKVDNLDNKKIVYQNSAYKMQASKMQSSQGGMKLVV